jgi:hypothetical protein
MDKFINADHTMKEKHASTNNWIKKIMLRNNLSEIYMHIAPELR